MNMLKKIVLGLSLIGVIAPQAQAFSFDILKNVGQLLIGQAYENPVLATIAAATFIAATRSSAKGVYTNYQQYQMAQQTDAAMSTIIQAVQNDLDCGSTYFLHQESVLKLVGDTITDNKVKEALLPKINDVYKNLKAYYVSFSLTDKSQEWYFKRLQDAVTGFNGTLSGNFSVSACRIDKTKLVMDLVEDLNNIRNQQPCEQNTIIASFHDNQSAQHLVINIYQAIDSKKLTVAQGYLDVLCDQLKINKIKIS